MALGFELYPLHWVNNVPRDAMAFNLRGAESNIFTLTAWDDDSHAFALRGKESTHAVTKVFSVAEGSPKAPDSVTAYGNHRTFFMILAIMFHHGDE